MCDKAAAAFLLSSNCCERTPLGAHADRKHEEGILGSVVQRSQWANGKAWQEATAGSGFGRNRCGQRQRPTLNTLVCVKGWENPCMMLQGSPVIMNVKFSAGKEG